MRWGVRTRVERAAARLRAGVVGRRSGISIQPGTAFGRGVQVSVADGGILQIGREVYIDRGSVLHVGAQGRLTMGDRCFVGHHSTLAAEEEIRLGEGTFLAELVSIRDHDHRRGHRPRDGGVECSPTTLDDDVWVGAKASVLRGVHIGSGAVVGAHSLVRSDVPAGHLAAGVPATIRRSRSASREERR